MDANALDIAQVPEEVGRQLERFFAERAAEIERIGAPVQSEVLSLIHIFEPTRRS